MEFIHCEQIGGSGPGASIWRGPGLREGCVQGVTVCMQGGGLREESGAQETRARCVGSSKSWDEVEFSSKMDRKELKEFSQGSANSG